jgi:hypothetical protein
LKTKRRKEEHVFTQFDPLAVFLYPSANRPVNKPSLPALEPLMAHGPLSLVKRIN